VRDCEPKKGQKSVLRSKKVESQRAERQHLVSGEHTREKGKIWKVRGSMTMLSALPGPPKMQEKGAPEFWTGKSRA